MRGENTLHGRPRSSPIPSPAVSFLCLALILAGAAQAQSTKSLPGSGMDVPAEELERLVRLCEGCHGAGGVSTREDVPSLAGRPAEELLAEIERFYFYERICPDVPVDEGDATRGHMSMCDVVNRITRPEALALSRHFEAQPVRP